jgi:hypothetical protein
VELRTRKSGIQTCFVSRDGGDAVWLPGDCALLDACVLT